MIMWLLMILFNVWYCEFLWRLMASGRKSPEFIQTIMKYYLGLNFILFFIGQTLGGLLILAVVSLYYMVIIPQRIWKINNNGPVAK